MGTIHGAPKVLPHEAQKPYHSKIFKKNTDTIVTDLEQLYRLHCLTVNT